VETSDGHKTGTTRPGIFIGYDSPSGLNGNGF
jgi:hypothetical protein